MWSPSDVLLTEYLAGHCTDADAHAIEQWLAADVANRARLDDLQLIWQGPWPPTADVDAMWNEVRGTIRHDQARDAFVQPSRSPRAFRLAAARRSAWIVPAAAAAVALIVVGGMLTRRRSPAAPASVAAVAMREYATPRGQRATFQLSDGTRLVLGAASRLRVPADYGRKVRDVYLDGEALFEVTHDATRPFRVRVKGATAEDIGTRFDVRAYSEDSVVAVAVAEGAVALGRADSSTVEDRPAGDVAQGVVLRQGELGLLTRGGRVLTSKGLAVEPYFSWVDGRLHFVETPLPDVLHAVSRWYDLDVRIGAPALAARTITAEFVTQSPDEVVRVLELALGARANQVGKVVTLYSER